MGIRLRILLVTLVVCLAAWIGIRWWIHVQERPYHRVEKGLYIGQAVNKPPQGTDAVVNLCHQTNAYHVKASLWEPLLQDGKPPSLECLRCIVDFITDQRDADQNVYVHCLAGQNRSASVVTAYLMRKYGWSKDEGLAFLKQRRPHIQPNPVMMRLLDEWEEHLMTNKPSEAIQ